jgi:hypothetical protein
MNGVLLNHRGRSWLLQTESAYGLTVNMVAAKATGLEERKLQAANLA